MNQDMMPSWLRTPSRLDTSPEKVQAKVKLKPSAPVLVLKTGVEVVLCDGPWWGTRRSNALWQARVFTALFNSKYPVIEVRATAEALFAKFMVAAEDMPLLTLQKVVDELRGIVHAA